MVPPGIRITASALTPDDALALARALRDATRGGIRRTASIGISGDSSAALGFAAGCDTWYSVLGGTPPEPALAITHAAGSGDHAGAQRDSNGLRPLWDLFATHSSYPVVAAIAESLGLVAPSCLPRPINGLTADAGRPIDDTRRALDLR